jgi:hypothetical protein
MGGYAAANIVPIAGNWPANGEGYRDGIGYYNPADGTWHLRNDATRPGGSNYSYRGIGGYASTEMVPVAGDWDGNVTDGVGYYIPADGTWHLRVDATRPGGSNFVLQFGAPDGIPVSGDWHGGLGDGVGYYNPADGTWHLRINVRWSGGSNYILNGFGSPTMIPIVGKWSTS